MTTTKWLKRILIASTCIAPLFADTVDTVNSVDTQHAIDSAQINYASEPDSIAAEMPSVPQTPVLEKGIELSINPDITNDSQTDNAETGRYSRKSITFIDNFWALDASIKQIPERYAEQALRELHSTIRIKRFDYNPVSDNVLSNFSAEVRRLSTRSLSGLSSALEKSLAPEVVALLDAQKEMRAANLLTEQQKNSFISDKAKELGYTIQEINRVMNSAFIYLPLAGDYVITESQDLYIAKMKLGVAWYKVEVNKGRVSVRFYKKTEQTAIGVANKYTHGVYKSRSSFVGEAHESMIQTATQSLAVATKSIAEFSLTAQIIEEDFWELGADIGYEEGIQLDDTFLIIQKVENEDGTIEEEEIGWSIVTSVADTGIQTIRGDDSTKTRNDGGTSGRYISTAMVVKGNPIQGDIIREHPRMALDLQFGWRQYAGVLKSGVDSEVLIEAKNGIFIEGLYNVGRTMGTNQLFFGLGIGYAFADDSKLKSKLQGSEEISSTILANYDFSITKKWYITRLALKAQAGISVGGLYFSDTEGDYNAHALGFFGSGGVELALSPSWNLSIVYRYDKGTPTDTNYEIFDIDANTTAVPLYDPTGLAIQVGLVWSLPSLSINFTDILKLATGI